MPHYTENARYYRESSTPPEYDVVSVRTRHPAQATYAPRPSNRQAAPRRTSRTSTSGAIASGVLGYVSTKLGLCFGSRAESIGQACLQAGWQLVKRDPKFEAIFFVLGASSVVLGKYAQKKGEKLFKMATQNLYDLFGEGSSQPRIERSGSANGQRFEANETNNSLVPYVQQSGYLEPERLRSQGTSRVYRGDSLTHDDQRPVIVRTVVRRPAYSDHW